MEPVKQKQYQKTEYVDKNSPQKVVQTTETVVPERVAGEHPQTNYQTKKVIFRSYQVIWYIAGVIEVLLFFRVILLMLAANRGNGFVDLILGLSTPFALPFLNMFSSSRVGNSVIEWSTIFAMVIYYLLAWGLVKLFQFINPVGPEKVVRTVDNQ